LRELISAKSKDLGKVGELPLRESFHPPAGGFAVSRFTIADCRLPIAEIKNPSSMNRQGWYMFFVLVIYAG
jgi:hypothetical protein